MAGRRKGPKSGPQRVRRSFRFRRRLCRLGRFADWRAVRRRQGVRSEFDASGTEKLAGCRGWGALREEAPPVARNRGCGLHLGAACLSSFAASFVKIANWVSCSQGACLGAKACPAAWPQAQVQSVKSLLGAMRPAAEETSAMERWLQGLQTCKWRQECSG